MCMWRLEAQCLVFQPRDECRSKNLKSQSACLALLTNHLHVVDADGKPGHFGGIVEDGHRQPAEAHVAGPDLTPSM